jgi:hypothetical protein
MKTIPFHEVREFYQRNRPEGHWFDKGSMAFFGTKLPESAYELSCGGIYFVTRETNPSGESRYSVRRQKHNGDIDTVGEFHKYKTAAAARAAIKQIEVLGA